MYRRRRLVVVILFALMMLCLAIFDTYHYYQNQPTETGHTSENQETELAVTALGKLAVKNIVYLQEYSRDEYGKNWLKLDNCDIRNIILERDLVDTQVDPKTCHVLSGKLIEDPYTGKTIDFVRGPSTSGDVQIDHVVALSDAWKKGAQSLSKEKRVEFANDPLNLLAVDGPKNMEKGDSDASQWLPRPEYRCRYIARQIAVKLKYSLWITKLEDQAMRRVLFTCPDQRLPLVEK